MPETPTTQLEAVNQMLRAIGESPVSTLVGDVGVDVVTAKQTLATIMKSVQTEGWQFNTEYGYPLQRDGNNEITVPGNAASVDVVKGYYGDNDPVLRGTKLYDRKNHTYTFDADLKATIIFLLPFEEMPESARHYIAYRATRKFQDDMVGSNDLNRYNARDEMTARIVFENDQAEDEDLNFIRDDPQLGKIWSL